VKAKQAMPLCAALLLALVSSVTAFSQQSQRSSTGSEGQAKNADPQGKKQPSQKDQGKSSESKTYDGNTVDPSEYVGSDTCKSCHEEMFNSFERGPHWKTETDKHHGPQWQGCEACHGPGRAHSESTNASDIINLKNLSREESSKRCLSCHEFGEEHANFLRSQHLKNNVGCIDCHSVHSAKVEHQLLKAAEPTLCFTCHQEIKADFSKPFHHKVNEGLIACSNCHNPHGGFNTHQLRATAAQDQVCFTCHADKAGPFAFEHAPVRTEGCVSCHTPHGSSNPRLLKRSQVNLLCLECHTFTVDSAAPAIPSFHNQAQKYQACTLCHVAIHGSNSDRFLFKP
jgi:DmsE family decaheme c-type cytochrome